MLIKLIVITGLIGMSMSLNATTLPTKNESNQSYNKAKKWLYSTVYPTSELKTTIYCENKFNSKRKIVAVPDGFSAKGSPKRLGRVEAEHVVSISNIGKHYPEYRGHPDCVDSKGRSFKGRNCVEKMNADYRYANADLYLLYPANGLINQLRSNYNFAQLGNISNNKVTGCDIKIDSKRRLVEPRDEVKGIAARTHLYATQAYPIFKLSRKQKQLFEAWDRLYPITAEECRRYNVIKSVQRSDNPILRERC
ncbi:endonuclease [Photobacterium leiognathi]|uniref:endonuclease n=1 Tax=Photobacterium leiognathi TaxID=553611 RepID=UPI002980CA69|nr:endonuclease [Photobacterium leiognathi]